MRADGASFFPNPRSRTHDNRRRTEGNCYFRSRRFRFMVCASITVDVDRDLNIAIAGKTSGVSFSRDGDPSPRFESSRRGLEIIVSVLKDLGIRGTFFLEAETALAISERANLREMLRPHEVACHGYSHEDLTGERTGVRLSDAEIEEIVDRSLASVKEITGRRPVGFRAPYLHINDSVLTAIAKKGISYDSSVVRRAEKGELFPYRIHGTLIEAPIASSADREGKKIVSYLWPLHERERRVSDYEYMVSRFSAGLLVLATHSWHVVESYASGKLAEEMVDENIRWMRSILQTAIDAGIEFCTIEEYVEERVGH